MEHFEVHITEKHIFSVEVEARDSAEAEELVREEYAVAPDNVKKSMVDGTVEVEAQ